MNSRLAEKFKELRNKNQKALITYITCGDPDIDTTFNLVLAMEKAGADVVELGIPYSDPLADGPVIQRAAQRALNAGTNVESVFNLASRLRGKTEIPLVFLVYFNVVYRYGLERFINTCRDIGIDGLIIPDLPLEERKEIREITRDYPLDLIPMVAPTSEDRIRDIVLEGEGFVYCISSKGVTGRRDHFEEDLGAFMKKVRKHTDLPLALGFGISDRNAVRKLKGLADGLIVGSAIIQEIEKGITEGYMEEKIFNFVKSLRQGLDS